MAIEMAHAVRIKMFEFKMLRRRAFRFGSIRGYGTSAGWEACDAF
ncbi:hypothetical protein [Rhizomicrobium electricum]|nr:hypothetical protein [Rhizomicrobium electricum]NIJ48302.1 hypothetical protein [Rhizomicrobium electricum]